MRRTFLPLQQDEAVKRRYGGYSVQRLVAELPTLEDHAKPVERSAKAIQHSSHKPRPRFLPKLHSTPPPGSITPVTS